MPRAATDLLHYLSDPATTLPEPYALADMAERIAALHQQNGGATFNLYFGDMSGQPLFAVSVFPDASTVVPGRVISLGVLEQFIKDSERLLHDPRNNIGTWYNAADDSTYLDVSTTLPDREAAIALAVRCNRIAIYDLANWEELPTFGTGEDDSILPPEQERLPPLTLVRGSGNHGNITSNHTSRSNTDTGQ